MEKQLIENLEEIKKKYQDLDQKIIKETKNNNFEIIKEYAKEQKKYQFTYQLYIKYLELEDDKKLINELKKFISNNKKEINMLEEKLLDSLIEKDPIDKYNAFIEIK